MLFWGTYPLTLEIGYILVCRPITVPGLSTLLQPTSTKSPRTAPIFLSPVSIFVPSYNDALIVTSVLSDFTFDVIEPAPIWDL